MQIPTNPACASASAIPSRLVRLAVMPCSKTTTGQPVVGLVAPEFVLGTVISIGTCSCFTVGTGNGLKRVVNVLILSGAVVAEACQYSVSGAVTLTAVVAR